MSALDQVVDALDVETFFTCKSEAEAKELAVALAHELHLTNPDVVFVEHRGLGARVRIRSYIHRPGDSYRWLTVRQEVGE